MLKRWKTWLLTFCLVGIVLCALESQRILTGWLRGEAFYQGRPTSYWRGELEGYRNTSFLSFSSYDIVILEKKMGFLERNLGWLRKDAQEEEPWPLLTGDPAALPVLEELSQDGNPSIVTLVIFAQDCLQGRKKQFLIRPMENN